MTYEKNDRIYVRECFAYVFSKNFMVSCLIFRGGHGNPLQYSCPENLMDKEACQVIVHRVTKSQIQLRRLSTHTYTHLIFKSLSHLELMFVYCVRECSNFIDFHVTFQLSQHHLQKSLFFFFMLYSCLLCQRVIDCRCVATFVLYSF